MAILSPMAEHTNCLKEAPENDKRTRHDIVQGVRRISLMKKEVSSGQGKYRYVGTTYEEYPVFFFFLVCSVGVYDCLCSVNAVVDMPVVRSIIYVGGHCCYP